MHDLVHDFAAYLNDNTIDGIHAARYVCWQSHGNEATGIQKEQARLLRTLFYEGEISDIMFSDFGSLHALTLRDDDVNELPNSIKELIHLRYLNITRTSIQNLPDSIGQLYHLQTFKAQNRSLQKLPKTFKNLLHLRHLHLLDDAELPPQLGMLTSLQTLPFFKVRNEEGHQIDELGSLKNLKGDLIIYNLENVQGEQESKKACLLQKPGIVRLVLRWDEEAEINGESVLNGLRPHSNLKMLEIFGFKGWFPSWTLHMEGFNNMVEIRLERCECVKIPTLGHLPGLKSLYLSGLSNVNSIGSSFYGVPKETCNVFPVLERLELMDMPNLTKWEEVEIPRAGETDKPPKVKVFPNLKYLKVENCKKLRSAPRHLWYDIETKMSKLSEMASLPNLISENYQNISVLEIISLPDLIYHTDQTITVLKITCNPKLIEFPDGLPKSSTLQRRLSITSEKVINFPREILESLALPLEVLELRGRPLEMQMIGECMHKMSRLEALTIDAVPKFTITSPVEVGALPNLKSFIFCPDGLGSWDSESFNKAADGILRSGRLSLRTLELTGNANWESLPGQLQHLTALSELRLSNFGIEELPEWFGELSTLSQLRLSFCNKLKGLPSDEVMQRLTKLTKLCIFKCRMLKGRCIEQHDDGDGTEWHKISHIPTLQVDGQYIRGGRIGS